ATPEPLKVDAGSSASETGSPKLTLRPAGPAAVAAPGAVPVPTIALAIEPKTERVISLRLSDVLKEVPSGLLKPAESFDPKQRVLLRASEIEKGMSESKPSVPLASIYEQVPEIFLRA